MGARRRYCRKAGQTSLFRADGGEVQVPEHEPDVRSGTIDALDVPP